MNVAKANGNTQEQMRLYKLLKDVCPLLIYPPPPLLCSLVPLLARTALIETLYRNLDGSTGLTDSPHSLWLAFESRPHHPDAVCYTLDMRPWTVQPCDVVWWCCAHAHTLVGGTWWWGYGMVAGVQPREAEPARRNMGGGCTNVYLHPNVLRVSGNGRRPSAVNAGRWSILVPEPLRTRSVLRPPGNLCRFDAPHD